MAAGDWDPRYDTASRTAVLEARGYSDTIVNGNGDSHGATVLTAPGRPLGPPDCIICGEPIDPRRRLAGAKTCPTEGCVREARTRRRRATRANGDTGRVASSPLAAAPQAAPVAAEPAGMAANPSGPPDRLHGPEITLGAVPGPPAGAEWLAAILRAFTLAGATIERTHLEATIASHTLVIDVTPNGRIPS